jgi:SAM-dependent methyltransferase
MSSKVILLGAGASKDRRIVVNGRQDFEGQDVVTLDYNHDHKPDIVADLEVLPYTWAQDNEYDEVHAYEVLEHTGTQGDWKFFFEQFSELHRILKPNGVLAASVPKWDSMWAWGDPSHKRVLNAGTLTFLMQKEYEKQVGKTAMSDFRFCYKADFELILTTFMGDSFYFALRAIK